MKGKESNKYISAKAAGEIVDLKPETIRMYARKGRISFVKIGRSVRFKVSDVLDLVSDQEAKHPNNNPTRGFYKINQINN